jgi:hypothetical protein
MDSQETSAILETRQRTKTNVAKITTQKSKNMGNTNPTTKTWR